MSSHTIASNNVKDIHTLVHIMSYLLDMHNLKFLHSSFYKRKVYLNYCNLYKITQGRN